MHIFIDESGSFAVPPDRSKPSINCAGALSVPDAELAALETAFAALAASWPKAGDEVKGRLLSESMIASCLQLFAAHGAMFDVACKRRSNNPSLKRPDNLVAPE